MSSGHDLQIIRDGSVDVAKAKERIMAIKRDLSQLRDCKTAKIEQKSIGSSPKVKFSLLMMDS